jgi:hypothetical protein
MNDDTAFGRWIRVLDDYERVLVATELALASDPMDDLPETDAFVPPDDLPGMPVELQARALALAERTRVVIRDTSAGLDRRRLTSAHLRPRRAREPAAAAMFDRRA